MSEGQVIKLKVGKHTFQALVHPHLVEGFRAGTIPLKDVLVSDQCYLDLKQGKRPSKEEIMAAFSTDKMMKALEQIVTKGQVQVSQTQRTESLQQKRAEIVNFIFQHYVDPKTKNPIPVTRIENGLAQLKFRANADQPTQKQALAIVKDLQSIIPMSYVEEVPGAQEQANVKRGPGGPDAKSKPGSHKQRGKK